MASQDVRRRALDLRAQIRHHDRLYYIESRQEIADAEYDALYRQLVELETAHPELVVPDSPTQRVGAPLEEGESFEKVAHEVAMLSIDSLFDEQEVLDFEEGVLRYLKLESGDELAWAVEPKFDGVSASLLYEDGLFVRGVTRGDGAVGELVTSNLRTVRNLPLRLTDEKRPVPRRLEVRGEVLIARETFAKLNKEREERGLPLLMNPRNATSGALRRKDPAEVARYPLELHTWGAPLCVGATFETHADQFQALRDWGLPDSGYGEVVTGIRACIEYHDRMEARRFEIPFDVDGIVAKLDRLDLRERLGQTARAMRWQYAHKFAAIEATSTLRAIEVQVGTNGRLTPRAHVDPVEVGGVVVRHTTLHNATHVQGLGLHVGDRVFLKRAGDVIPQIIGVSKPAQGRAPKGWREGLPEELLEADGAGAGETPNVRPGVTWGWREELVMPERCPACGTQTLEHGRYWLCPNGLACKPQLVGRVELLAGRGAFEIDRIGKKLIERLVDAGLIRIPADVFHLRREDLLGLERWGEKSVDNLFAQLEQRRGVPFERFLVALGIPEVGGATARLLARHFASPGELAEASEEDLQGLEGIGPEMAREIATWFRSDANRAFVQRLLDGGVTILEPDPSSGGGGPFAGKRLCITGTLETMSRAEAKRRIEVLGGQVVSGVSAKTDYLVVGDKPGSKRKKAEELGIEVLDEEAFLKIGAAGT